jgi:peptidoglycan/LPS O-acetylase OafA/YrhL
MKPTHLLSSWLKPTIGDLAVGRDNNFNLLRFFAASLVLLFHCYALIGHHVSELPFPTVVGFMDLGLIGVAIFFAISGFLIAQSVTRSRSILAYVEARVLRIMPALVLATAFCVFIVGPTATTLPQAEYWRDAATWRYFFHTIALGPQWYLPGVFEGIAYPGAVSGSLWTIPVEVWCYVVIGILSVLGIGKLQWAFMVFLLVAVFCLHAR